MNDQIVPSDVAILDLLRKHGSLSVTDLSSMMEVTATAVRQRLNRLMGQGYIDRSLEKADRGRPSHRYDLTSQGRRKTGSNFADLAIALWEEVREIKDLEVRKGLLQRLSKRMANHYSDRVQGTTAVEKMEEIANIFQERNIPFIVEKKGELPMLTALACPYPDLAEEDHSICAFERLVISELMGEDIRLKHCRVDSSDCCQFEQKKRTS